METTDKIKIYGKWLTDKKWGELRVTLAPCCMAQGPAGPGLEGGRLCILSESLVLVLQAPPALILFLGPMQILEDMDWTCLGWVL